jgi:hypothetical protein
MLYLKVFEEFETGDFELEFVPKWKFDQSYQNTQRVGFSDKIYQAFALNANRNGMRAGKVGGEYPTQITLNWNKQTKIGRVIFVSTFLVRGVEGDTPYVLCLVDYNIIGTDMQLTSIYIRMELQDMMGIIKNFEKFSNEIVEKVEKDSLKK